MRKIPFLFVFALLAILASCSNEVSAPESAESNDIDGLFIQSRMSRFVDLQVWEETGSVEFSDDIDGMKVTANKEWLGIAIVKSESNEDKYFHLENVTYLSFEVKGTIPLDRAWVNIDGLRAIGDEKTLEEWAVDDNYSENSSCKILIDISGMNEDEKTMVESLFVLVCKNQEGEEQTFLPGQWIEISNIDFLDSNQEHVDISCEKNSYQKGSWQTIFKEGMDFLEMQVWDDTCTIELRNTGLRIYSKGETWFGGALVAEDGEYVDFSKVSSISFDIKGNMSPDAVKIGFKAIGYDGGLALSLLDPSKVFTEDESANYTIEVPSDFTDIQKKYISVPIYFSQWESYESGKWFELSNITFKDSTGNSIKLEISKFNETSTDDWNVLFKNFDVNETPIDLQIWKDWEGNAETYLTQEGLKIIPTGGWAGGGIVNYKANQGLSDYEAFDFSKIRKMEFEIKGDIDPASLKIYVQRNARLAENGEPISELATPSGTLKELDSTMSIGANSWSKVSINIPEELEIVDYPLAFVTENKTSYGIDSNEGWAGRYFILRNVVFYDESGNPVQLKYQK